MLGNLQHLMAQTDAVSDALDGLVGSPTGTLFPVAWAAAELPTRRARRLPQGCPESRPVG